ncbi:MAG: TrkH family potassium uptake protein, partial [Flavobacteriaceae bacterium]
QKRPLLLEFYSIQQCVHQGLGDVGPASTYASLPTLGKWWCAFLMLIGRLELFTVLILLSPYYWRKH